MDEQAGVIIPLGGVGGAYIKGDNVGFSPLPKTLVFGHWARAKPERPMWGFSPLAENTALLGHCRQTAYCIYHHRANKGGVRSGGRGGWWVERSPDSTPPTL